MAPKRSAAAHWNVSVRVTVVTLVPLLADDAVAGDGDEVLRH
jgi:hypothetical protein